MVFFVEVIGAELAEGAQLGAGRRRVLSPDRDRILRRSVEMAVDARSSPLAGARRAVVMTRERSLWGEVR